MKTAVAALLVGAVVGQDKYPQEPPKLDVPIVDPVGSGPYDPPAPVDPKPVDPPPYDGGVDPAPVDPAPVDDVYDDNGVDDDSDDDEYDDQKPPYPSPAYDDVYDDGNVDPDYQDKAPVPDIDNPKPDYQAPAPVYEAPAQKGCGALYVDVIQHWLQQVLAHIPQEVIQHILQLLGELLGYVKDLNPSDPQSLAKVIEHVKTIASYCDEYIVDDDVKGYVVEAFTKMQQTYGSVYDTAVDDHVYQAWDHLWGSCKGTNDTHAPDYVDQFYNAYTGYLKEGPSSPTYQDDIDHLCHSTDPAVSKYANDTKYAVETLSQEANDDGSVAAENASSQVIVSVMGVAAAAVAMFF